MAKKSEFLMYKGRPLVRNGKTIYYGYMSDPYVAILQITSTREVKVVELESPCPACQHRPRCPHEG